MPEDVSTTRYAPIWKSSGISFRKRQSCFLVIWFAVRLVQYRRYRKNQPLFSEHDRALLFPQSKIDLGSPIRRVKFARCILLATTATYVEFLVLAPFGAAILSVALVLTTAGIVHGILLDHA